MLKVERGDTKRSEAPQLELEAEGAIRDGIMHCSDTKILVSQMAKTW